MYFCDLMKVYGNMNGKDFKVCFYVELSKAHVFALFFKMHSDPPTMQLQYKFKTYYDFSFGWTLFRH